MKNSTIFLIASFATILITLTGYNLTLKAIYEKGDHKVNYRNQEFTPVKGIQQIQINNANTIAMVIEKGAKEGVYIRKSLKDQVKWSVKNHVLTIDIVAKDKLVTVVGARDILIVTNGLQRVDTKPHLSNKKEKLSKEESEKVYISGVTQDSLSLNADGSTIVLNNSNLKHLNVVVGSKEYGGAGLQIENDNNIQSADFTVNNLSTLTLNNPNITTTNYKLGALATVTLNGRALQPLQAQRN